MIRRFAAALVLLCLLPVAVQAKLPAPVAQALARAAIPTSSVALTVQDVTARKPLIAVNADQSMNPASVMKLVTAFAALELLGPAYTWRTEVYLGGPLKDGVLHGDLILKGYGDPKLTIERFWLLLHTLRARGLREIRGDLVLDRSYFDPGPHDAADDPGEAGERGRVRRAGKESPGHLPLRRRAASDERLGNLSPALDLAHALLIRRHYRALRMSVAARRLRRCASCDSLNVSRNGPDVCAFGAAPYTGACPG